MRTRLAPRVMGLERTLRHHCDLEGSNPSAAAVLSANHGRMTRARDARDGYCEGERFSGGGQDFHRARHRSLRCPFKDAMNGLARGLRRARQSLRSAACDAFAGEASERTGRLP